MTLGILAALAVGVLVFWVQPAVQRARSPLGEIVSPPFVVRYVKTSPISADIVELRNWARDQWHKILQLLGLTGFPARIYAATEELNLGISARIEEELAAAAVTDLVICERGAGEIARLACSLALGRPGNPVFPADFLCTLTTRDTRGLRRLGPGFPMLMRNPFGRKRKAWFRVILGKLCTFRSTPAGWVPPSLGKPRAAFCRFCPATRGAGLRPLGSTRLLGGQLLGRSKRSVGRGSRSTDRSFPRFCTACLSGKSATPVLCRALPPVPRTRRNRVLPAFRARE